MITVSGCTDMTNYAPFFGGMQYPNLSAGGNIVPQGQAVGLSMNAGGLPGVAGVTFASHGPIPQAQFGGIIPPQGYGNNQPLPTFGIAPSGGTQTGTQSTPANNSPNLPGGSDPYSRTLQQYLEYIMGPAGGTSYPTL